MDSDSATTQATLSPTYRTLSTESAVSSCPTGRMPYLLGASAPVTTVTTPSRARALLASMRLITACGYGECRILPMSIPESERSSVYFPAPVVLPAESMRATGFPIMEKALMQVPALRLSAFHCLYIESRRIWIRCRTAEEVNTVHQQRVANSLRGSFQAYALLHHNPLICG